MALLWWSNIFRNFGVLWYICICMKPQIVIGFNSVWVRYMSGTRRFWFRNVVGRLHPIRCHVGLNSSWIGVRYICPIHNQSNNTDQPFGGHRWPNWYRHVPERSPTKPTPHRHITDRQPTICRERSFKMFVCPNINLHQTDKTESMPIVERSLPQFDHFSRFEVGFVSAWSVWSVY